MESKQELLPPAQQVAAFDEFRSQLNELQVGNSKAVFDYRDKKGNQEARSHVAKLRTTKAAIEKKRVAEKEEFLVKGRLVDADAKYLTAVVQSMIEVHETPLKEIENEEKQRIEKHKLQIELIESSSFITPDFSSATIAEKIAALNSLVIDESMQEFEAEAHRAKANCLAVLNSAYAAKVIYENEQAELAKLRAEAVAREQKDHEERIARESAENARIAAEQAAANAIRDAQLATERAQREKAESEAREKQALIDAQAREVAQKEASERAIKQAADLAEKQRLQAIADTEARIAREKAAEDAAAAKLAANKANQKRKNNDVLAFLMAHHNMTEEAAKALIKDIALSNIPWLTINY